MENIEDRDDEIRYEYDYKDIYIYTYLFCMTNFMKSRIKMIKWRGVRDGKDIMI